METGEEDARLGEHFVQSLSKELPHYQAHLSGLGLQLGPDTLRLSAQEHAGSMSVPSVQYSYQAVPSAISGPSASRASQVAIDVPQNLTKPSSALQAVASSAGMSASLTAALAQKIALLPVGSSGTEFLPVRIGNLAANLPLLAAKLTSSSGINQSSTMTNPQMTSVGLVSEDGTTKHLMPIASKKSKLLLVSSDGHVTQQSLDINKTVPTSQSLMREDISDSGIDPSTLNYLAENSAGSAIKHVSVRSDVQPAMASPVYKSKLEKAMAQNQLMQSTARGNRQAANKLSAVPLEQIKPMHQTEIRQEPVPIIRQSIYTEIPRGSTESELGLAASALNSASQQDVMFSPSDLPVQPSLSARPIQLKKEPIIKLPRYEQDVLSVTKVAERYKNMVRRQAIAKSQRTADHNVYLQAVSANQVVSSQYPNHDLSQFSAGARNQNLNFEFNSNSTNQDALFGYMPPPSYSQPMEMEDHGALVTEKVYKDGSLVNTMMKFLWQLREEERYCDAIIFTGTDPVKLHKLVLMAASPEIQKKSSELSDPEMKLVVPEGITTTNLLTFLYFIYVGEIRLTVDNVQQVYRLSCIFGVDGLRKYCYNFCKEAKMGHLIIASPYQETARHIDSLDKLGTKQGEQVSKANKSVHQVSSQPVFPQPTRVSISAPKVTSVPESAPQVPASGYSVMATGTAALSIVHASTKSSTIPTSNLTMTTSSPESSLSNSLLPQLPPKISDCVTTFDTFSPNMNNATKDMVSDPTIAKRSAGQADVGVQVLTSSTSAAAVDNKLVETSDIDWVTHDPSQSNIPIRKRGRNRKTIGSQNTTNVGVGTKATNQKDVVGRMLSVEANTQADKPREGTVLQDAELTLGESLMEDRNKLTQLKSQSGQNFDSTSVDTSSPASTGFASAKGRRKVMAGKNRKVKPMPGYSENLTSSLPDPLSSGKLDENELLKLDLVSDLSDNVNVGHQSPQNSSPQTNGRAQMTRFRRRPANMSVLEAASQKKAKSNDLSPSCTKAGSRSKQGKRSPLNKSVGSVSGSTVQLPLVQKELIKPIGENDKQKQQLGITSVSVTVPKTVHTQINTNNLSNQEANTVRNSVNNSNGVDPEFGGDLKIDESQVFAADANIGVQSADAEEFLREVTSDMGRDQLEEMTKENQIYATPPKKARLRKSTLDHVDIKDKVYMRPPPKKRTKEIREMMKHEESDRVPDAQRDTAAGGLKAVNQSNDLVLVMDLEGNSIQNAAKKDNSKRRSRKSRGKDEGLFEKCAELDLIASDVPGLKLLRCSFCDIEFQFSKRALSHVIAMHEVSVDDCVQYVTVENKDMPTKNIKVCDICGYQAKECGIYYIHYHKYFRHNVPLPRGLKVFSCDLCKKEFFTKFQLREHKLIHFEDNPFVCDTCGNRFKSRTCLNSHVFHKHNKTKRFKCPDCSKMFKTKTQIKVHSRIHSGEKPFLCQVLECKYRSTTRGNMKLHLLSKHKLEANIVKTMMEQLTSEFENVEKDASFETPPTEHSVTSAQTVPTKSMLYRRTDNQQNETGPLEILVLTEENENVNITDNSSFMGASGTIAIGNSTIQDFELTSQQDKAATLNEIREFNTLVQNANISTVESLDHSLDKLNLPPHVQMLIQQESDGYHSHQTQSNDTSHLVGDPSQSTMTLPNTVSSTHVRLSGHDTTSHELPPHFNQPSLDLSRYTSTVTTDDNPKVLEPHSREARMILKEAFEGQTQRLPSLGKTSLPQGASFDKRLTLDYKLNTQGASGLSAQDVDQSPLSFHEADSLVIDLQDPGTPPEDPVVQSLRNQLHQFRANSQHYRDTSGESQLLRTDQNMQELLQNISSQTQQQQQTTVDQSHFPAIYHHARPNSPPAYQPTAHSLVSMPVGDLESRQGLTLNTMTQGQGQMSQEATLVGQGQGYSNLVPGAHSATQGQYGAENNLYPGYYENQYDIENY